MMIVSSPSPCPPPPRTPGSGPNHPLLLIRLCGRHCTRWTGSWRERERDSTAQQHPHGGDETISPRQQQDPSGGSRALRNIARGAGRYYARSKVSFPASVFPPLLAEEGHLESGHCGRGQRIGKRCFTNARRICKRCQVGTCGRYARMHAVNRYMYCIVR